MSIKIIPLIVEDAILQEITMQRRKYYELV